MSRVWIITGVIVAVVLGIGVVLVNQKPKVTQPELEEATQQGPSEPVISAIAEATYSAQYLASLSEEERKVAELDLTGTDTLRTKGDLITTVAKTSDELEIANCEPKPLVYRTALNSTFTIRNSGPKPYNIQSAGAIDITVPAGSSSKITANFKTGPGTYTYSCGTKPKGIFLITP